MLAIISWNDSQTKNLFQLGIYAQRKRERVFCFFHVHYALVWIFGRFRKNNAAVATANKDSRSIIPGGRTSGMVLLTLRVAAAVFPPASIAVTL